ncbi:phosphoethanolamine transferase domain-containing protein [Helicobacter sp. T3_23-1056]
MPKSQIFAKSSADFALYSKTIDFRANFLLKSSIFVATFLLLWFMCEVLIFRAYAKIFLGFLFVIAGVCSYFLDSLHISFSPAIIDSLLQTNWREASDFMSLSFFAHLVVFVLSPLFVLAILHYFTRQNLTFFQSFKAEMVSKISILLSLAMLLIALYFCARL